MGTRRNDILDFSVKYSILMRQGTDENEKYDMKGPLRVVFPSFFGDSAHFLYIEGDGKEGKVHFDLV